MLPPLLSTPLPARTTIVPDAAAVVLDWDGGWHAAGWAAASTSSWHRSSHDTARLSAQQLLLAPLSLTCPPPLFFLVLPQPLWTFLRPTTLLHRTRWAGLPRVTLRSMGPCVGRQVHQQAAVEVLMVDEYTHV